MNQLTNLKKQTIKKIVENHIITYNVVIISNKDRQ